MYCNESNERSSESGQYFIVSKCQNSISPNATKRKCIIDKEFSYPLRLPEGSFYIFVFYREFKNEKFQLHTIGPLKVKIGPDKSVLSTLEVSKESISKQALEFVEAMANDLEKSIQKLRH
ncbi:MAG: hypothetical protein AB1403_05255 [Candidatus Riflebacteria bacterium]